VYERVKQDMDRGQALMLCHCAEGVDAFSRGEFWTLRDRGLLTPHTTLIHALGLTDEDWDAVVHVGAKAIWSPVSNIRLYGRTLEVKRLLLDKKVKLALAPDWSMSGSSSMIDEIRFVRQHFPFLTSKQVFEMTTSSAGEIM
jgi:5-methylthioadenosine/S-adenosylhomocysteine deaminase